MLKLKQTKKLNWLLASILATFFVFVPMQADNFLFVSAVNAQDFESEFDWIDGDGYEHINGEVTWKKGDHIIEKGLFIENGGVLNIEKGARVLFRSNPDQEPYLDVYDGKIVAKGTQEEKITFASTESDGFYRVIFQTTPESGQSFFRFVDFVGMPMELEEGGFLSLKKSFLINTAMAKETSFPSVILFQTGKVHIENSTFRDSRVSVDTYIGEDRNQNVSLEIVNSNFELAESGMAVTSQLRCYDELPLADCQSHVLLKNNWYGNASGPLLDLDIDNPTDRVIVYGNLALDGWRSNGLILDPVLVVPGIMGSGQLLGRWQLDPITHIYDDLVFSLEANGFVKNLNLFEFPYNWKNNNQTSARYLQSKIEGIISETKVSKVDVVAHSMGGLIARAYIEEIEGADYEDTIDQLITLGTPNQGSPAAYLKWEAGEGFFTWSDKLAKYHFQQEAEHEDYADLGKYIREKVLSAKQLLPVYDYLVEVSDGEMRAYPENYPRNTFLEDLNEQTNLEKLKKIDYTNIIGNLENENSTISKIRVVKSAVAGKWEDGMPENFDDGGTDRGLEHDNGDETVPITSSRGVEANKEIEVTATHQDLPSEAQCEVFTELSGKFDCQFVDNWHVTNVLLFNVFSPIDIQIISPSGEKYGKDFENDKIFESVGGSFYSGYAGVENEFVAIPNPEEGEYKILTQGTGNGTYRVEIVKISENPAVSSEAVESVVEIEGLAALGKLDEVIIETDEQNVINKNQNQDLTPPETQIELTGAQGLNDWFIGNVEVTLAAFDGENGSGVEKTNYSLDNGTTWLEYAAPVVVLQEGINNFQYFSTDSEGNKEEIKSKEFKIDKTAPEAKFIFNSLTQKLELFGQDNLSQEISTETKEQVVTDYFYKKNLKRWPWLFGWSKKDKKIILTTTLNDEAGHKTELVWEEKKYKNNFIDLAVLSLSYDGSEEEILKNKLQYKWIFDSKRKNYLLFASSLGSGLASLESHYMPKKDQTWIMEKPGELVDDNDDDNAQQRLIRKKMSGLVIPNMTTDNGMLKLSY